jgi:hypothetical protein
MLNFKILSIMKARLLKITLSFAMLFIAAGTFAQGPYPAGNQINSGSVASPLDSVTAGQPIPYYVSPDPVLNPSFGGSYDPNNTGDGLNSSEDWTWWLGSGIGGSTANQGVDADGNPDGPYIEVTWNAPGGDPVTDSIYVQENNTSVTCGGDTSGLQVLVFDPPAFTPVDNGDGNPSTDAFIELCGSQQYDINLASITDNSVTTGNLKIRLDSIAVDNVSASAPQGGSTADIRATEDTVVVWTGTPVNDDGSAETLQPLLSNYNINVQNNDVTRYRFVFEEDGVSNGGLTDGISDQISRKSDYIAVGGSDPADDQSWTYYAATAGTDGNTTRDIVVYPKPQTGDIYYVPHDFDQ